MKSTRSFPTESCQVKAIHDTSTREGKFRAEIAGYFEEPISLFTVYDYLGFVTSVTVSGCNHSFIG